MELLLVVAAFVALDLLAMRYGADSRRLGEPLPETLAFDDGVPMSPRPSLRRRVARLILALADGIDPSARQRNAAAT